MIPEIITYESKTAESKERWVARLVMGRNRAGYPDPSMIFTGPTEDDVADKAELWWRKETQKAKRTEAKAIPSEPAVIDDAKRRKLAGLEKARAARWGKKVEAGA